MRREALGKTPGEPTTEAEMATLTNLRCPEVASLAGLEHATSLVYLAINNNDVSDLSPLSGLTSLRRLEAGIGAIADVSSLADLTGLTKLVLPANNISDVTPLAGLTSLRYLDIGQNGRLGHFRPRRAHIPHLSGHLQQPPSPTFRSSLG